MTVGLIGHGLLGAAIGERLSAAGHELAVCDPAIETPFLSPRAVSEVTDCVFLCLPDSSHTAEILAEIPPEHLIIDATTGAPEQMETFGSERPRYIDATIGGSSNHLRRGEAIVMAGATEETFASALPLLTALSATVILCGGPGAGARMKLVFNMVLGLNRAALAEGLAFGEAQGLNGELMLRVLQAGPAASQIMKSKGAKMLARDYTPEARLRQHHKDVRLMQELCVRLGQPAPLTDAHERVLTAAENAGWADSDNSSLIEVYRRDSVGKP